MFDTWILSELIVWVDLGIWECRLKYIHEYRADSGENSS
jgi:hypothetical protein